MVREPLESLLNLPVVDRRVEPLYHSTVAEGRPGSDKLRESVTVDSGSPVTMRFPSAITGGPVQQQHMNIIHTDRRVIWGPYAALMKCGYIGRLDLFWL